MYVVHVHVAFTALPSDPLSPPAPPFTPHQGYCSSTLPFWATSAVSPTRPSTTSRYSSSSSGECSACDPKPLCLLARIAASMSAHLLHRNKPRARRVHRAAARRMHCSATHAVCTAVTTTHIITTTLHHHSLLSCNAHPPRSPIPPRPPFSIALHTG